MSDSLVSNIARIFIRGSYARTDSALPARYRLDNAAIIMPPIITDVSTSLFHLSADMVTGDYGLTAVSIARHIGMIGPEEKAQDCLISGQDLAKLDDEGLKRRLGGKGSLIFARVNPEQKMRVVSALKEMGEVVAVTGDGVNDAAALKKADIGIAMGREVNDVAKEAASMLVLDGNFASIVHAVEEGRAVYANIRRFSTYVLASNMPELAPFILFVLFKMPLALTVMQILAIDLGTDLVPALGLGAETPEPGIMKRPPRSPKERIVNGKVLARAYLWQGGMERSLFNALPNNPVNIGSSTLVHTIGKPATYLTRDAMASLIKKSGGFWHSGQGVSIGQGGASSGISVYQGEDTSTDYTVGVSISVDAEMTVAGVIFGSSRGFAYDYAYSVSTGTGTEISGTTPDLASTAPSTYLFTYGIAAYKTTVSGQKAPFMLDRDSLSDSGQVPSDRKSVV